MKNIFRALTTFLFLICGWAGARAGEGNPEDAIALIQGVRGDVKLRRADELIWNFAVNMQRLFQQDVIKTGEDAGATIWFFDDSKVKLQEKSMIVILKNQTNRQDPAKRSASVALPSGTISGALDRNVDRPIELVIRTTKGWIRAKSTEAESTRFQATVIPGGLKVNSESGQVTVQTRDHERIVKRGETLTISDPTPSPANAAELMKSSAYDELPQSSAKAWSHPPAVRGTSEKDEAAPRKKVAESHSKPTRNDAPKALATARPRALPTLSAPSGPREEDDPLLRAPRINGH